MNFQSTKPALDSEKLATATTVATPALVLPVLDPIAAAAKSGRMALIKNATSASARHRRRQALR